MSATPHPPNRASSPISRRTMLTFSAAAGLGGLCAGYVHFTRPLLTPQEPTAGQKSAPQDELPAGPQDPLALKYLPDEPWAASAAWIVRNGQSVIYFNSVKPVNEDNKPFEKNKALRLEPFAMIFPPRDDEPDAQPLTIAGEAAILRFQGTIDFPNPDPGRIINVNIPKTVKLRGPDGLEIHGSNFTFNENAQRLWSDDDVRFRQGPNQGRGHGMQLELFRVGQADAFESVAVSGVKVFRLLRDVDMELVLDDQEGGPFAALSGESTPESPTNEPAAPTRVQCAGSFTFDLETNLARFDESVVASREVAGDEPDRLECDTLEIQFEPATPEAKQLAAERRRKIQNGTLTEDDGFQGIDSNLEAKTLIAHGHEHVATLHSPANEFVAEFDTLIHDAQSGVTTLRREGRERRVVALQETNKLESPTILLKPGEGDLPPTIVCEGTGKLHHRDEEGNLALSAYWKERLVRSRQADGMDLIQLVGEAQVNQPQEDFTLAGGEIDLWLLPAKQTDDAAPAANTAMLDSSQVEPHKLIARENVMLRSPELAADAAQLNVNFVPTEPTLTRNVSEETQKLARSASEGTQSLALPLGKPPSSAGASTSAQEIAESKTGEYANATRRQSRANLVHASKHIQLASAAETTEITPPGKPAPAESDPKETESAPPIPLEMVAQIINVEMARTAPGETPAASDSSANRDARVLKVDTEGGVTVRQRRGEDSEPLIIRGDRLELLNKGKNKELIHIFGQYGLISDEGKTREPEPAQVHDGESDLWAMNINLDRATNTAWVKGEGILLLPADGTAGIMSLDESTPEEPDAEEPKPDAVTDVKLTENKPPSRLEIRWGERMDFDGQTATFLGDVRASLNQDNVLCQEMVVELLERVDFASLDSDTNSEGSDNQPDVATIFCKDRVVVDGGEYEDDTLVSRRHAEFADLHVDQQTGETRAHGPGLIKMWSLGEPENPEEAGNNGQVQANSTADPSTREWEYTYVEFAGTSEGNFKHRTTTFHDRVTVIYGPVSNHTQELDPHRIDLAPKEAGWMDCEHLTLTQHRATKSRPAYSEALARGNVRLKGREFQGIADQVTFDESKDQYILKSFGDRDAIISMGGRGTQTGQEFKFYPKRNDLNIINAQGGQALPQ